MYAGDRSPIGMFGKTNLESENKTRICKYMEEKRKDVFCKIKNA